MRREPQIAQMTETADLFGNHRETSSGAKNSVKEILRPPPPIREIFAICGCLFRISLGISFRISL
jgi:hypothetical protein